MVSRILFALAMLIAVHQAASQVDPLLTGAPLALPVAAPTPVTPLPDTPVPTGAAAACNFTPTWFPEKYENAADPYPLDFESQNGAGWTGVGDPWRVGLSDAAVPKFYMGVNWFMLEQDKVPAECMAYIKSLMCPTAAAVVTKETGPAGRHLLQSAVVTRAISYNVVWQLNDGDINTMPPVGSARRPTLINLAKSWSSTPDGDYCLRATVSVPARSGTITMAGKVYDVPCQKLTKTIKYCFVKVAKKPTAKVKWSSCNSNFTVTVTDIVPRPALANADSTPPAQLFSVIVQVWGNATKDDIDDTRTDDRPTDFTFDSSETIEIKDPLKNSAVFSTDKLLDGRYSLHVMLRLKSMYPQLNNLSGPTPSADGSTTTYQGVPALNGAKGVKVVVYHEKSDVYGVTCPTDPVVQLPAPRTFQWSSTGEGAFTCLVDGKPIGKKNGCVAPLQYTLTDRKNHTLEIVFLDKCSQIIRKKVRFGAWGCLLDRTGEPPAPPPPPPPAPEDMGSQINPLAGLGLNGSFPTTSWAAPQYMPTLWATFALALVLAVQLLH